MKPLGAAWCAHAGVNQGRSNHRKGTGMSIQSGEIQPQKRTRRQNIEQKRGKQAWSFIKFIKEESPKRKDQNDALQKEYRTRASQLNSMIQINGLGPALGFLKSKGKATYKDKNEKDQPGPNAYYYLLDHLTQWFRSISFDLEMPDKYDGLLTWITDTASSSDYRRATAECMAFGIWLRRFAEGELKTAETTSTTSATDSNSQEDKR